MTKSKLWLLQPMCNWLPSYPRASVWSCTRRTGRLTTWRRYRRGSSPWRRAPCRRSSVCGATSWASSASTCSTTASSPRWRTSDTPGRRGSDRWAALFRRAVVGTFCLFQYRSHKTKILKISRVSSQKWCKTISYYHGNLKQTLVYLISPSVLILMKWVVIKQDFFLVLWLNHLQL